MDKLDKTVQGFLLLVLLSITFFPTSSAAAAGASPAEKVTWYETSAEGKVVIHLYFFWSKKCPHCLKARPDILAIDQDFPWLKLHSLELTEHPENVQQFIAMAASFGEEARSVPTFMFCNNMLSGYEDKQTSGELLKSHLQDCRQLVENQTGIANRYTDRPAELISLDVPLLGTISSDSYSLPALTILIAGMDAFNPCAFFVLLFLLSMMVHSRSRARMALIGGIFVFFSGAVYFLFMAAWLNLFLYLGELRVITLLAGSFAVVIAGFNIKDYFWFKKGLSLSINDTDKPKLIDRIRLLLRLDSMPTVIFATVVLAIVANSYELLCTAGFPMVYTRILTLNALSPQSYYGYLLLYNLVYILPLLLIVMLFTIKLGSRKLSQQEGQVLKLLSGVMMLLLGLLLLLAPQLLNMVTVAVAILLIAILATWLIVRLTGTKYS